MDPACEGRTSSLSSSMQDVCGFKGHWTRPQARGSTVLLHHVLGRLWSFSSTGSYTSSEGPEVHVGGLVYYAPLERRKLGEAR